ncbi:MAG: hypothetical protein DMF79_13410 [Acidobacteria bacterium]|nr:MAG: hypothetical protein DMF79_13410 [Acidobacteriota bacterium]
MHWAEVQQVPEPLHRPQAEQDPWWGKSWKGTFVQVPNAPGTSQAMHCAVQAVLQQKPSAQKPLPHWFAPAHEAPLACLGTQIPPPQ